MNDNVAEQQEWIRQDNVISGGLIAISVVMIQPFLTAVSLDMSARICVIAFSVAIPLLAALVMVNQQEFFRRRASGGCAVSVGKSLAQFAAVAGVAAGFWHITWIAGVGFMVSGTVGVFVHSAGWWRVERNRILSGPGQPQ